MLKASEQNWVQFYTTIELLIIYRPQKVTAANLLLKHMELSKAPSTRTTNLCFISKVQQIISSADMQRYDEKKRV